MAAMYLIPPTVTLIVNLLSATLYAKKSHADAVRRLSRTGHAGRVDHEPDAVDAMP